MQRGRLLQVELLGVGPAIGLRQSIESQLRSVRCAAGERGELKYDQALS